MPCFTIVWDTPAKEKVAKWSPAPASILEGFNEIYVVYGPKKPYKTREKRQSCQIDPCLPPYFPEFRKLRVDWEKRSRTPPCFSEELFCADRGKNLVVDMVPDFNRVWVSTSGSENFSEASKVSKRISFSDGSVPFFLLSEVI